MNVLPSSGPDTVGAVALLKYADKVERDRFNSLEEAVWTRTTLPPAVIEAVRLRCAHIRGCASCSAVRFSAATRDGLSEADITLLDSASERSAFSEPQQAALTLVEHFLLDPRPPSDPEEIAGILGTAGVMEVLLACAAFSSSELRLALGEDRAPEANIVVDRDRVAPRERPKANHWPALDRPILDTAVEFAEIDTEFAGLVRGRISALRSNGDLPEAVLGAVVVRSMQLHRIDATQPIAWLLAPVRMVLPDAAHVRNYPSWPRDFARSVLALAEQLWMDPSGIGEEVAGPVRQEIGIGGLIRVTWDLIWLGQLHRLALVLHRGRDAGLAIRDAR